MTEPSTVRPAPARGEETLAMIRAPTDRLTVGSDGALMIDGLNAAALVERFGSPLQVSVEATIRENYRAIRAAFAGRWPSPVTVMYAIKCNNNLAVRAILSAEGAGGDCFGLGELYASLAGGADPRRLVMNGSNKTQEEVTAAVGLGVAINVDSVDEVEFLRNAVARTCSSARVNLRLKIMPGDLERHLLPSYRTPEGAAERVRRMKWGFTPEAAVPLIATLRAMEGVELTGYSVHIGHLSTEPAAFAAVSAATGSAIRRLAELTGFFPVILDIGGGWPQVREPSARDPAPNAHAIDAYAEAALAALRRALGEAAALPALWIEPGRYITANAQLLLATVGSVKRDSGMTWIHVDASTNDLPRIESGQHWYHLLPASRMRSALTEEVEIVGSTCFRSVLGAARRMPRLQRGDIVAVLDTGMYAEVFANQFNGVPRPATVLVSGGEAAIIKRRETIADVFATQTVPPHLVAAAPAHPAGTSLLAADQSWSRNAP